MPRLRGAGAPRAGPRLLRLGAGDRGAALQVPLFPSEDGSPVSKAAAAATIVEAARRGGMAVQRPDGVVRLTGHSLRIGGAQSLSRAGFDPWEVALLARWGSAAVLQYIRDAPLLASTSWARRAAAALAPAQAAQQEAAAAAAAAQAALGQARAAASESSGLIAEVRRAGRAPPPCEAWERLLDSRIAAVVADVKEAVLDELRAGMPAAEVVAVAQAEPPEAEGELALVRNEASGVVHWVADGSMVRPPAAWRPKCGWRFGGADRPGVLGVALPRAGRLVCGSCLPASRARLLRARTGGRCGRARRRSLTCCARVGIAGSVRPGMHLPGA